MERAALILAAGAGTRMKSATPKVLHAVANLPMLGHVIGAARGAGIGRIVVVSAAGGEAVRAYAKAQGCETVIQERQLGTGHAVAAAASALADFGGVLAVTYGDMPLLTPELFALAFAAQEKAGLALLAVRSASAAYGRVILGRDGMLDRVVEYRDANASERAVDLCNAGLMAAAAKPFLGWTAKLENKNAQKEYYLTDVPAIAKSEGAACAVVECDALLVMGVNSRAELAAAEAAMQARLRTRALDAGAGLVAPETIFLSHDTWLEADCRVAPFVVFGPGVRVAARADIRGFCHIENSEIGADTIVGPFARLRGGTKLDAGADIGNFVELKHTHLETGVKAHHLSYLGDTHVGAGANIGAGTITCNYDGFDKHRTEIGAGAFIGSNAALVAPVTVGDGAIVAAGSVITADVKANALALGRARQVNKPGRASEIRTRNKAKKDKKK